MIRVFGDGENRHRLENASGTRIGWIRGRVVGFHGVRDENEAKEAVLAAYPPLEAALRQHYPGWPHHQPSAEGVRLVTDGAYEWVADRTQPLARLVRPAHGRNRGPLGVEFVLPSYASEGVAMSVAQVLARALHPFLVDSASVDEDAVDETASATA